jgi:hypothetical protein
MQGSNNVNYINDLCVQIDSNSIFSISSVTVSTWTTATATFTPTATSHVLTFAAFNPTGPFLAVFIDNIQIIAPAATVASTAASPSYYLMNPVNVAMQALTPYGCLYNPISFSINPPLPAGLSLNIVTGAVTGTPTTVALAPVVYTIKADNGIGINTFYVSITVTFPYNYPTGVTTVGNSANPLTSLIVSWTAATAWYV